MEKFVDLHTHTYYSDGTVSPVVLVKEAAKCNLSAVAVTDHDTIQGIREALVQATLSGVEVIPGIEMTSYLQNDIEIHVVGLFINDNSDELLTSLEQVEKDREKRNLLMLDKLKKMGLNIDFPIPVKGGIINRTHMAKELVNKGYCSSISEAYEMYLKPAYVKRETLSPLKTISVIKKAGGTAVLAHLNQLKVKENEILDILKYLKENGLSGIEAYYPEYTDEFTQFCLELCKKTHLLPSGGSDYHGGNKKNMLGTGFGSLRVPYSFLEGLRKSCQ